MQETTTAAPVSPYAKVPDNRASRRWARARRAKTFDLTGARQTFVARIAEQNVRIAEIKLTVPQRRALDAVALENSAPVAPGSIVTDAMFAKLEAHGLVRVDLRRPHRAALTDLGMAYLRRGPKVVTL